MYVRPLRLIAVAASVTEALAAKGFQPNPDKTKTVIQMRGSGAVAEAKRAQRGRGPPYGEAVRVARYLGFKVVGTGDVRQELKTRIAQGAWHGLTLRRPSRNGCLAARRGSCSLLRWWALSCLVWSPSL